MALQSQLLHDLERGVQWIAGAMGQRNPDKLPMALECRIRTSGDVSSPVTR